MDLGHESPARCGKRQRLTQDRVSVLQLQRTNGAFLHTHWLTRLREACRDGGDCNVERAEGCGPIRFVVQNLGKRQDELNRVSMNRPEC